ncbi:DUF3006 domain-containing protein [Exiguobacterium sp. s193]|uniref:DUF3006 domain-containing protein n=1 Tax=Exiguobacterium sp. s193 TaxID=2751207 RepID=UPI001BEA6904|nr:DUF3006 domain-containing protein [Exiguobacterium sp. s193]
MKMTVTAFEDDLALCETEARETITVPRRRLPVAATIGDRLEWQGRSIRILRTETANRRREVEQLMDELFED